jgi:hypothetical protein
VPLRARKAALSQAGELRAKSPSELGTKRRGTSEQSLEAKKIRPHVTPELDALNQGLGAPWQPIEARVVRASWGLSISVRTTRAAAV